MPLGLPAARHDGKQRSLWRTRRSISYSASVPDEGPDLREMVREAMREWSVSGVALAVLRRDRIVFAEGFGVRAAGAGGAVTEETIFPIGSCTKPYTTTAIAMLADEGTLSWDAPVREYLPEFEMRDPFASERATLRDLALHRTGLPPHAFAWYGAPLPVEAMLGRLPHLEPCADFRATYQYNNLAFAVAGCAAGRVAGAGWEELVRRRVFAPLGLARSFCSVEEAQAAENAQTARGSSADGGLARPHVLDRPSMAGARIVPFQGYEAVAPAATVCASAADVAQWLLVHLAAEGSSAPNTAGTPGTTALVSARQLRELHRAQVVTSDPAFPPALSHVCAGLGWNTVVFRGETLVRHGGEFDGFRALVSFMPHRGLGVVCLANLHRTWLPYVTTYGAYERLLGLSRTPWTALFQNRRVPRAGAAAEPTDSPTRVTPVRDARAYVGEYHDAGYGTVLVDTAESGSGRLGEAPQLRATLGRLKAMLTPREADTFDLSFAWPTATATARGVFGRDDAGRIASLAVQLEPLVAPITFIRGTGSA